MDAIVVIGDELSCAGFRLAGVPTRCPAAAERVAVFAQALAGAALVVLTQAQARALPAETLRRALAREQPLVAVLPDLVDPRPDLAFERRIHALLGIDA